MHLSGLVAILKALLLISMVVFVQVNDDAIAVIIVNKTFDRDLLLVGTCRCDYVNISENLN